MAPQISTRWSLKRSEVVFMKTPFVTKDQLEAIAAQYPTPFHIYDEQGIREMPAVCGLHLPGIPATGSISP